MLLYVHDVFESHDTGQHPECIARITRLNHRLTQKGWLDRTIRPNWEAASIEQLAAVHDPVYLSNLQTWCEVGKRQIESDTYVSTGSWQSACMAAGAAIDACQRVLSGPETTAFCALRPPGHHALRDRPMGFCLVNHIAVAARSAIAAGAGRVLIIDWDVHHGNGTQDAFYEDGKVGFYSIHRSPFYPGTGASSETGTGAGLGLVANDPVPADISPKTFTDRFTRGIEDLAKRCQPELILLSAGFDAHRNDPVGSLCLEEEDFAELTSIVLEVARQHCGGRVVSLLEGGYHLEHMPESVLAHLNVLGEDT